jgi:hypothetical protein
MAGRTDKRRKLRRGTPQHIADPSIPTIIQLDLSIPSNQAFQLHKLGHTLWFLICFFLCGNTTAWCKLIQGQCKAWHMPLIGTLSAGVWTISVREKWNMVKIDDPQ